MNTTPTPPDDRMKKRPEPADQYIVQDEGGTHLSSEMEAGVGDEDDEEEQDETSP